MRWLQVAAGDDDPLLNIVQLKASETPGFSGMCGARGQPGDRMHPPRLQAGLAVAFSFLWLANIFAIMIRWYIQLA